MADVPVLTTGWPSPGPPTRANAHVIPNLLLTTLAATAVLGPFTQSHWPTPRPPVARQVGFTQARPFFFADQFPVGAQTGIRWEIRPPQPTPPVRWQGYTHERPFFFVDPYPPGKSEMRGARPPVPGAPTVYPPNQTLLDTPFTPKPFLQAHWPVPLRAADYTTSVAITVPPPADPLPFFQTPWPPAPRVQKGPTVTSWWQARPFFFSDQFPVGEVEFARPRVVPQIASSVVSTPGPTVTGPFNQEDWPSVPRVKQPGYTLLGVRPFFFTDQYPVGYAELRGARPPVPGVPPLYPPNTAVLQTASLPFTQSSWPGVVRIKPPGQTWTWTRPPAFVDQFPVGASESKIQRPVARGGIPIGPSNALPLVSAPAPFYQTSWPGVVRVKPPGLTWLNPRPFFFADTVPVGALELRGARRPVPGVPAIIPPNLTIADTPIVFLPFTQSYWPLSPPKRLMTPFAQQQPGPGLTPAPIRQKAGCMLVGSYHRTIDLTGSV